MTVGQIYSLCRHSPPAPDREGSRRSRSLAEVFAIKRAMWDDMSFTIPNFAMGENSSIPGNELSDLPPAAISASEDEATS
jgi:hypothetical protein